MPKVEIDYSNTVIYKIVCKNANVNDMYIGHTTNFIQKKHAHKQTCNNIKSSGYNLKLYKFIRENGGWSNWEMSIINIYNCTDHLEAKKKEQEYCVSLGDSLNILQVTKANKIINTCEKYNNSHDVLQKIEEISDKNNISNFKCMCGHIYKHMSGLSRHKKTCYLQNNKDNINKEGNKDINAENEVSDKQLLLTILKENSELKTLILDVCKNITSSGSSNTNITNNNNNKTFNIQVYLNEECKDALNISEFVNSIKLQLHDLEETGRLGYVDGVSKIITTKLNDLDATKRPIQCSDMKRETLYIKDEDKWVKEGNEKDKIKLAIKQIANKNIQQIPIWVKANPDCMDSDSRKNDTYLQIVSNAMSGSSKEEQSENLNKIVTKISKESTIEK